MKTKHKPKVIAIYCPTSTVKGAKKRKEIADQKAAVVRAADHHGLNVRTEIELNGAQPKMCATSALCEAQRKISSGEFDGVVFSSLQLMVRTWDPQVIEMINQIGEAGACIYTERDVFDLKTPEGCFAVQMEFTIEGSARERAKRRAARGRTPKRRE